MRRLNAVHEDEVCAGGLAAAEQLVEQIAAALLAGALLTSSWPTTTHAT
jgi:hypothetical protein